MSQDESSPTALERRERRPTGTILFLAALFALPIGTCGGIGGSKVADSRSEMIATTVAELRRADGAIEDGAYVAFDAKLRHVGTDELPLGDGYAVTARGVSLHAVEGAPGLFVASGSDRPLPPGEEVHVEGRICSDDAHLSCTVNPDVRTFLRASERRTGADARVITRGAQPSENLIEAFVGLSIAASLSLGFLVLAVILVRGRRGPRISVERIVAVREASDPPRIARHLGPRFRIANASADKVVLLTGPPAARAQLLGASSPEDYPLRVEIWLSGGSYRQASARIRVSEIFAQPMGPPPGLAPRVRFALDATMQYVAHALETA